MITIEWRESKHFRGVIEAHGLPLWHTPWCDRKWLMWIETRPPY